MDETVEAASRIKAIELLYNRVLGLPRQNVDLHASIERRPYERMIADSIVPTVADALDLLEREKQSEVVDGEIVVEGR